MLHSLLVSVSGDDTGNEAPSPSQWRRLISVLGAKTGRGFTSQPLRGRGHVCLLMALCFWFLLLSTLEVRWGYRLLLGGSGIQNETNVSGYCNFMVSNIHAGMEWENSVWPDPTKAKGGCCTTPVLRGNLVFFLLTTNHHLKQSLKGPPCPNAVMMMRGSVS